MKLFENLNLTVLTSNLNLIINDKTSKKYMKLWEFGKYFLNFFSFYWCFIIYYTVWVVHHVPLLFQDCTTCNVLLNKETHKQRYQYFFTFQFRHGCIVHSANVNKVLFISKIKTINLYCQIKSTKITFLLLLEFSFE